MTAYVTRLEDLDRSQSAVVGGKAAHLGELGGIEGVAVPAGFCVTTDAYHQVLAEAPIVAEAIARLEAMEADDPARVSAARAVRALITARPVPAAVVDAITGALSYLGAGSPVAVRSSAADEDGAAASYAGQHDTFLHLRGVADVLGAVRNCWASLYSDRAVAYRRRASPTPRAGGHPAMAVIVQRMVSPTASGVAFTADPVTSNRHVTCIEAVPGVGDTMVAGRHTPTSYRVADDRIVAPTPAPGAPLGVEGPLTSTQILDLARLARKVATHFGTPQDIEWALEKDSLWLLQTRPITTLYPVPPSPDGALHVYLSVGHQQMMTDAMRPLGLSFWQMTTPRPMAEAGGRLFADATSILASPATRDGFLAAMERSDPLTADALRSLLVRPGFSLPVPEQPPPSPPGVAPVAPIEVDPAVVEDLIASSEMSVARAGEAIAGLEGEALLDFIEADLQELRRILFDPRSHQVFMSAMEAGHWLDAHLEEWLGEKGAAAVLSRSVPHNVTSEMGMALLDVADALRPHPDVVAYLRALHSDGDGDGAGAGDPDSAAGGLERLDHLAGGAEVRRALQAFLDRYGMRCAGEIDITRERWAERPSTLVPLLLRHVDAFGPGAGAARVARGRQEAEEMAADLLSRLRSLPEGEQRARDTEERIHRLRTYIGYREYPKYGMVSRYFVYRQALLREADRLVAAGVLDQADDIAYLTFAELRGVVASGDLDPTLIRRRREEHRSFEALTPPRVITSEGEVHQGRYRSGDLPAGALAGLGVSAGTVEGRARVVQDMARADLRPGDILVTTFTDPSWTPAFVLVAGLVTEVGGMMTHGAVIAREYGLPAVVGVDGATRRITEGQRIRVHGAAGYVEVLDEAPTPA